jgi:hypothetical protein
MSGVHIFGWTSLSTTDESRCTRKAFSSNAKDLSRALADHVASYPAAAK